MAERPDGRGLVLSGRAKVEVVLLLLLDFPASRRTVGLVKFDSLTGLANRGHASLNG